MSPAPRAMWACCADSSSDDDEHNTSDTLPLLFAEAFVAPALLADLSEVDELMVASSCRFALDIFTVAQQDRPRPEPDLSRPRPENLSQNRIYRCSSHNFFFAIYRVVNVVNAPNAIIGEWRNCFESVPGANVRWWSQYMDGRSGWGVVVVAEACG